MEHKKNYKIYVEDKGKKYASIHPTGESKPWNSRGKEF
jgi:hypothetical protein